MDLLFHQAALGDFALTLPLMRSLGGPVTVVAPWARAHTAARLLPGVTPIDIEMFEFTRLYAEGGPTHLSPAVADLFPQATRLISFVSSGHDAWATNVARLSPQAACFYVDPRPDTAWAGHVTAWHLRQLADQGLSLAAPADAQVGGDKAGPVLVHPGSGGLAKCWPVERFEALICGLVNAGRRVKPVLGEVELERWPPERVERWRSGWDAEVCQSPLELLPILNTAAFYIGNDAGPTHLAAQVGLPTLALFGPTDPTRWAPVGPGVRVLAPPDGPVTMDWLDVDTVLDAANTLAAGTMPLI